MLLQGRSQQPSPRDSDVPSQGLLPKMKTVNWNQDLSGTAISQYETFDEDDSSGGPGKGDSYAHLSKQVIHFVHMGSRGSASSQSSKRGISTLTQSILFLHSCTEAIQHDCMACKLGHLL